MSDPSNSGSTTNPFAEMLTMPAETWSKMFAASTPMAAANAGSMQWADVVSRLQEKWAEFQAEQEKNGLAVNGPFGNPAEWVATLEAWGKQMPLSRPEVQNQLWSDGLELWQNVLGQFGIGAPASDGAGAAKLPRADRRFADPKWRENPFFAVVHQTYLLLGERMKQLADQVEGLEPAQKQQLKFTTNAIVDALSPANFPLTNPLVMQRAIETNGESLVKGLEHLISDLKRGQLTHTDPTAFKVGENIATTPGKVVYESPLFQLIQYSPATESVLATPLLIFPPWINRFYILDLNPAKSFVRWAVEQGLTVFMVSWKSADGSMADVVWDDYIRAQIEAVDTVCQRLKVKSTHVVGYCVAGTTLAATLALLGRRGKADTIKSATFFTAQVDFENAGDLKNFIDNQQLAAIQALGTSGFVDGRVMAATFNSLRGKDLIWNYVVEHYLLGKDYPAFDLLHWNGDSTNLPAKWHQAYLRDLYRDNRLVVPDSLEVDGTKIDLRHIKTPCYIQSGREDHIAPPESVWKLTRHVSGPWTFVLAGSGHIAGVVNPPSAGKYQYWTFDGSAESLEEFVAGATEHPGSWWPHWLAWLRAHDPAEVPAKGKRVPGSRGDRVIENAPGRYVIAR